MKLLLLLLLLSPKVFAEVNLQIEDNYYSIDGNNTHYANAALELLKRDTEIQLATYNCPLSGGGAQNFECDTYINLSQTFRIVDSLTGNISSQNGTVFGKYVKWHSISSTGLEYTHKNISIRIGAYFVNKALSLTANYVGYTTGISYNFNDDIHVVADYASGSNNMSGATVNLWYKQVYFGVGVPEAHSGNEFFGIIGFKYNIFK